MRYFLILLFNIFIFVSCSGKDTKIDETKETGNVMEKPQENQPEASSKNVNFKIEVLGKVPHDINAYTQGLTFYDGLLYESTGQYGESSLRKIDPETGNVIQKTALLAIYFGEGVTIYDDKIYCLTWLEKSCLVYDPFSLSYQKQLQYQGEGWGLTDDGNRFIMSNGSSYLYFRDPTTFAIIGNVQVKYNNYPLLNINELEYVDSLIFANIYQQDMIAVIDPETGQVLQWLDFSFLRDEIRDSPGAEVLNGIAYDRENDIYFLTGKNWPYIFKVRLTQ